VPTLRDPLAVFRDVESTRTRASTGWVTASNAIRHNCAQLRKPREEVHEMDESYVRELARRYPTMRRNGPLPALASTRECTTEVFKPVTNAG
jgi:hypothetical protein